MKPVTRIRSQNTKQERLQMLSEAVNRSIEFIQAIEGETGKILVEEIAYETKRLHKLIADDNATDVDRADFRAYMKIGKSWAGKIQLAAKNMEDYKKEEPNG